MAPLSPLKIKRFASQFDKDCKELLKTVLVVLCDESSVGRFLVERLIINKELRRLTWISFHRDQVVCEETNMSDHRRASEQLRNKTKKKKRKVYLIG